MPLARFDGYIATDEPLDLKQVIFVAGHRCVVKEQMDRAQWQAERTAQNRTRLKEVLGYVRTETDKIGHADPSDRGDGREPPPAAGHWFYGISWLPEEMPMSQPLSKVAAARRKIDKDARDKERS